MGGMGRRQYFVEGARLMLLDLNLPVSAVAPVNPVMVADGIISIRAQYGKDTDNDGYINEYNNAPPANVREVVAVRLAVVARSVQLEKTAVSPATLELWTGGTTANGGAIALTPEEQLYRYKVYQTTVPLRNVIWAN
jgi:type IV pilus assembly protein PilW